MNIKKMSEFIVFFLTLVCIYGCGENETNQSFGVENENELHEMIIPYLFLNDSQYELRLSKQQALAKGISEDQYEEVYYDIQQVNAYIQDHINDFNHTFVFNDPQQKKEILPTRSVNDIETPDGNIHALRDYYSNNTSLYVSIPRGYSKIQVTVTPKCYFSVVTIGVGSEKKTFTFGGGTEVFNIGMSPSNITINISSNCDSGGSIGYTIMN